MAVEGPDLDERAPTGDGAFADLDRPAALNLLRQLQRQVRPDAAYAQRISNWLQIADFLAHPDLVKYWGPARPERIRSDPENLGRSRACGVGDAGRRIEPAAHTYYRQRILFPTCGESENLSSLLPGP